MIFCKQQGFRRVAATMIVAASGTVGTSGLANIVSVQLMGQMGNQMFEVAAAYAYALDHNLQLRIPDLVLRGSEEDIQANYEVIFSKVSAEPLPAANWVRFAQPHFSDYTPIPIADNICLSGLFQTERYFAHRRKEILDLFSLEERWPSLVAKFPSLQSSNKIGIHMRMGYEPVRDVSERHHTFGGRYIEKAMQALPPAETYIVVSNNIPMARILLAEIDAPFVFLESTDRFDDLLVLSKCDHLIGTNSTFSWWGAWLGAQEGRRCIFPLPWLRQNREFPDLLPSRWETISCPEMALEGTSWAELPEILRQQSAGFKH